MTPKELIDDFKDLVDYYYEKVEECNTYSELMELNWYCKDRVINFGYTAFNETWNRGYNKPSVDEEEGA